MCRVTGALAEQPFVGNPGENHCAHICASWKSGNSGERCSSGDRHSFSARLGQCAGPKLPTAMHDYFGLFQLRLKQILTETKRRRPAAPGSHRGQSPPFGPRPRSSVLSQMRRFWNKPPSRRSTPAAVRPSGRRWGEPHGSRLGGSGSVEATRVRSIPCPTSGNPCARFPVREQ